MWHVGTADSGESWLVSHTSQRGRGDTESLVQYVKFILELIWLTAFAFVF